MLKYLVIYQITKPALVIVATEGLLLIHVPPVAGATVVVNPTQIVFGPVKLTFGLLLTVTGAVGSDAQPPVAVKIKVAVPALTAVTTPPLVTVATPVLLLAHVPPVVGDKVVEVPIQIKLAPVILTVGLFVTVIGAVGSDVQPVVDEVNVNVAVPTPTPVTSPLFATVAIPALLLCHVPPVVGDNCDVKPTQIDGEPVIDTVGLSPTVISTSVFVQPVPFSVNL